MGVVTGEPTLSATLGRSRVRTNLGGRTSSTPTKSGAGDSMDSLNGNSLKRLNGLCGTQMSSIEIHVSLMLCLLP